MKEMNFEQVKAQIEAAGERAGTPLGPEKWNLETKSGMAYLNTAIRVGQIHHNIPNRTFPKLQEKFAQMEAASRVGERQARVDDIAHMAEKGHLDRPVLDQAREELETFRSGFPARIIMLTTPFTLQATNEPKVSTLQLPSTPDTERRRLAHETIQVTLPYGIKIDVLGPIKASVMSQLSENFNNESGITKGEFATRLYGSDSNKSRKKAQEIIKLIRKDLPPYWHIDLFDGKYKLVQPEDVDEEIVAVETVTSDEELIAKAKSYQEQLSAKELLLTEMREHATSVSDDPLVRQILERHEKELEELLKNKDSDSDLKKGLELLEIIK